MIPLFREQAVRHATKRLGGETILVTPLSVWLIGGTIVSILAAAITFSINATYARKSVVVGWLTPEAGIVRIRAIRGGSISELHIVEGQPIQAGDRVASLKVSSTSPEGDVGSIVAEALNVQADAAKAQADATLLRLDREASRLTAQAAGLKNEMALMQHQLDMQRHRVALIKMDAARMQDAASEGLVPQVEADSRNVTVVDAEISLTNIEQTVARLEHQLSDVNARLFTIPVDKKLAIANAEAAAAALAERTTQTNAGYEYVVTSPISGRIDAVTARQGQTITGGAVIAALSPDDSELIAELYVPSRAAGFIQQGQDVQLKYQAFPHQRFGVGRARIESVSLSVLLPTEVSIPGAQVSEPVFRVIARLEREEIDAYGDVIPLRAGMLLSADIIIEQRTLVEWLFDPLYAAGNL